MKKKRAIQLEKVDDADFFAALIPIKKMLNMFLILKIRMYITRLRDPYSFGRFDVVVIFNKFAAGTEYTHITFLVIRCAKKTAFQVCF